MKYLRTFGLAAVAAMALTAFLGGGSASATVLCEEAPVEGICPAGSDYAAGTTVDASLSESATLWTLKSGTHEEGTLLDTCKGSTVKGKTSNTGGKEEAVKGSIEELTWTECSKTSETKSLGSIEIEWLEGTSNGTLIGKGSKVLVNTAFGKCTYGTKAEGTDLGTLKGGATASIDIAATVALIEDDTVFKVCPTLAFWTAKYKFTSPEPLYVAGS